MFLIPEETVLSVCMVFLCVLALVFVSAYVHGQQLKWQVDRLRLKWWERYDRDEEWRRTAACQPQVSHE